MDVERWGIQKGEDEYMKNKNISKDCSLERIECSGNVFFVIVLVPATAKAGDTIKLPEVIHCPVNEINLAAQFPAPDERDNPPYFGRDEIVLGWPPTGARTLLVLGKMGATKVGA